MKKTNLLLSILSILTLGSAAFASTPGHGVERMLPADARNVQVAAVEIGSDVVSQEVINNGDSGPINTYGPVLEVTVTYDSKDGTDNATALNNSGSAEEVVGGPTLTFLLPVTAAEVDAFKTKRLDLKSLVAFAVIQKAVQIENEEFTASCRFDSEHNGALNPECIKTTYTEELRPVVMIDRK